MSQSSVCRDHHHALLPPTVLIRRRGATTQLLSITVEGLGWTGYVCVCVCVNSNYHYRRTAPIPRIADYDVLELLSFVL